MVRGLLLVGVLAGVPTAVSAQQPCTTDARHVVDELYRHILERSAGAASDPWVQQLQNGTTVREIVRQIAKSPEHTQRFYNPGEGAAANERAVATLYRHLLGRQPDPSGQRDFSATAARDGLGAVVDAIVNSTEYNQNVGDWGVPGSGGVTYCGPSNQSSAVGTSGVTNDRMRWAGLDANHDGVINRREWRGNNRSFSLHDWNGDGVLSGDEVRAGASPPANAEESRDYSMPVNDRFDYLDVNGNGAVDRNEWDGSLDAFYRLDRNDDGKLTRAELGSTQTNSSFAGLDTNRDNRISLAEWPWSHRSFDEQDADGDGVITAREFRPGAVPRQ